MFCTIDKTGGGNVADYLYDSNGVRTSARKGDDDKPITDVNIKGSEVKEVVLHNSTVANNNGSEFEVGQFKILTLEVYGTATAHKVVFEGCSKSGTWYPIQGIRVSDFASATETTTKGEVWEFGVTGLEKFRARLATVTGGNINVKGNAVS